MMTDFFILGWIILNFTAE